MNISCSKITYGIILLCSLGLAGCANQMAPPGGIVDRIPPGVVATNPANGTVNFRNNEIELEFSEYVDKRSVQDAVFISPAVDGTPEFDWSGRSVKIKLPGKLKDSVTYLVTIGTEVADMNNRNNMAQAFSLSFSTGNVIDKGIIEGKIYNREPAGVMLLAYDVSSGTVNPASMKPKYISQSGSNGFYRLSGLAWGHYRVFAVRDGFRDLLYNKGQDDFGAPFDDVVLSPADTAFSGMNFFLSREDTIAPRLTNASMTDRNHVILEFSEEFDSTLISSNNFQLIDSTRNLRIKPVYAFRGRTKETELALAFRDSIPADNNYYIAAVNIADKAGNRTNRDYTPVVANLRSDTSKPAMLSVSTGALNQTELKNAGFGFSFDDAFDSTLAAKGISVLDKSGRAIDYNVRFFDDASFQITISGELKPKSDYKLNIDLKKIVDAAGNFSDSVYTLKFSTSLGTDYSGLSGLVEEPGSAKDSTVLVMLKGAGDNKKNYRTKINKNRTFEFPRVQPGKYILWSFKDKNSNGKFDYGRVFPFEAAEKFTVSPDTLNLRARWPVSDAVIIYKK